MDISVFLRKVHYLIDAKEARSVPYHEMSERIGVSHRTYSEYMRGKNAPLAMSALLNLLSQLDGDTLVKLLEEWQSCNPKRNDKSLF